MRLGLAHELAPAGGADDAAAALAAKIAAASGFALRHGKATLRASSAAAAAGGAADLDAAYTIAGDAMVAGMAHRDANEGVGAFLEKRVRICDRYVLAVKLDHHP